MKNLWGLMLVFAACTDTRWARISGEATRVSLSRQSIGSFAKSECETKQLGDYAFEVRCGDQVSWVRCGYHHAMSCCWPVEDAGAATSLFGQSVETRRDVVCEGYLTSP